jgi:hypothetical protein
VIILNRVYGSLCENLDNKNITMIQWLRWLYDLFGDEIKHNVSVNTFFYILQGWMQLVGCVHQMSTNPPIVCF